MLASRHGLSDLPVVEETWHAEPFGSKARAKPIHNIRIRCDTIVGQERIHFPFNGFLWVSTGDCNWSER